MTPEVDPFSPHADWICPHALQGIHLGPEATLDVRLLPVQLPARQTFAILLVRSCS
jgi:hypothetical protein